MQNGQTIFICSQIFSIYSSKNQRFVQCLVWGDYCLKLSIL